MIAISIICVILLILIGCLTWYMDNQIQKTLIDLMRFQESQQKEIDELYEMMEDMLSKFGKGAEK